MKLKWTKINPEKASIDEIKKEIDRLESLKNLKWGMEQGIKIFINSIYGALASIYFAGYNTRIAEAITLQGQDLTKFAKKVIDRYFIEIWHKDKETHKKMGITGPVQKCSTEATVYGDTDSVAGDSIIPTENGDISIENLYSMGKKEMGKTLTGHESVSCELNLYNYDKQTKSITLQKPKRIIRHQVTKPKWRIVTKTGKEIFVTGDHSIIIWRNGKEQEIRAKDIIKGDKVMKIA